MTTKTHETYRFKINYFWPVKKVYKTALFKKCFAKFNMYRCKFDDFHAGVTLPPKLNRHLIIKSFMTLGSYMLHNIPDSDLLPIGLFKIFAIQNQKTVLAPIFVGIFNLRPKTEY